MPDGEGDYKICTECGSEKPLDQFYRWANKRPNRRCDWKFSSLCRECSRAASRRASLRNAENNAGPTVEEKRCNACKRIRPASKFGRTRVTKTGLQSWCYECQRDKRHGLQPGEFDRRKSKQSGVCAICKQKCPRSFELSVDHDHSCCSEKAKSCGKCVRGLLCQNCNAGLGMFKDNIALLEEAIAYLKRGGAESG